MRNPLVDTKPVSVTLRASPLERVLSAVNFSPVMKIADRSGSGVAEFQDRIRQTYPQMEMATESALQVQIDPTGEPSSQLVSNNVWKFSNLDKSWRVNLSSDKISIETDTGYVSRDDLLIRLLKLVNAVGLCFEPAQITRIGFRYLNVIHTGRFKNLDSYVNPQLRSYAAESFFNKVLLSNTTTEFEIPEGRLLVKHGILGANQLYEFGFPPSDKRRWYLDLDAINQLERPFCIDSLETEAKALTSRICSFFRWSVTDDFLKSEY